MTSIRNMLRSRPLFTKIFLSIFICFIIPVIIAGNVFYHYAATDARASYQSNSQIFLSYLTELSDEALIPIKTSMQEQAVRMNSKRNQSFSDRVTYFKDSIAAVKNTNLSVVSVFLYSLDDSHVFSDRGAISIDKYFTKYMTIEEMKPEDFREFLGSQHGFSIYTVSLTAKGYSADLPRILFVYRYYDIVCCFVTETSLLSNMLNGLQVSWNGDIYVLDSLNTPLFHSDEITPAVQGLLSRELSQSAPYRFSDEKNGACTAYIKRGAQGLGFVNILPDRLINAEAAKTRTFTIYLISLLTLISLLLSFFLSGQIVKPTESIYRHIVGQEDDAQEKGLNLFEKNPTYLSIHSHLEDLHSKNAALESMLELNKNSIRKQIILSLLEGRYSNDESLHSQLSELNINFGYSCFYVALAQYDIFKSSSEYPEETVSQAQTVIDQLFGIWNYAVPCRVESVCLRKNLYAYIFNTDSASTEGLKQDLEKILEITDLDNSVMRLTLVISDPAAELQEIPAALNACLIRADYRTLNLQSQLLPVSAPEPEDAAHLFHFPPSLRLVLTNYLNAGDAKNAKQVVHAALEENISSGLPYIYLREGLSLLVAMFSTVLASHGLSLKDALSSDVYTDLNVLASFMDITEYFDRLCEEACAAIAALSDQRAPILEQVSKYVEKHYMEDISLGVIGDQVGLSPKYFSRYFKEQTGVPFSQYVNRFRVDRAKRLLAEPQSQVKLVAQQVGFENVNTFIRVFKSFEGISPGIYKETLLKKESDADPR